MLAQDDQSGNIFFSPLSIGSALAMAYAGSRGDTAAQLEQVLGLQGTPRKVTARGHRGLLRWFQVTGRGSEGEVDLYGPRPYNHTAE